MSCREDRTTCTLCAVNKLACRRGIKLEAILECWKIESKFTPTFQGIWQKKCINKWYPDPYKGDDISGPTFFKIILIFKYYSFTDLGSRQLELFVTEQICIRVSFSEPLAMLFPLPTLSFLSNFKHSKLCILQVQLKCYFPYKTRPMIEPKSPFPLPRTELITPGFQCHWSNHRFVTQQLYTFSVVSHYLLQCSACDQVPHAEPIPVFYQ